MSEKSIDIIFPVSTIDVRAFYSKVTLSFNFSQYFDNNTYKYGGLLSWLYEGGRWSKVCEKCGKSPTIAGDLAYLSIVLENPL